MMMDLELNHIQDKFNQCLNSQSPTFTDFMDLAVLKWYNASSKSTKDIHVLEYSGFKDDERRMIGFFPSSYDSFMTLDQMYSIFPVICLSLRIHDNEKTSITHRDVLGSILGLGLDRKLFGDIIVENACAYILCHERIVPVIKQELLLIRHSHVTVEEVDSDFDGSELAPSSLQIKTTVASLRIDVIMKAILNLSRSTCNELIERGHVKINQIEVTKNHKLIEVGDLISISKKGKYKIGDIGIENKKGRIPIIIEQYI